MFMHFINNRTSRLVRFSPDDPAGGGDDEAAKKAAAEEAAAKAKQEEEDKKYAERANRAAAAKEKQILETLGVSNPEEAKKLIESARKADEANKSELEKAEAARKQAEEKAEQAKKEAQALVETANKKLMDSEIKTTAAQALKDKDGKVTRSAFRKDALNDVLLLINRDGITDKDGEFEGVDKALDRLAKDKPWLLEAETPKDRKGGPVDRKSRERGQDDPEKRTPIVRSL